MLNSDRAHIGRRPIHIALNELTTMVQAVRNDRHCCTCLSPNGKQIMVKTVLELGSLIRPRGLDPIGKSIIAYTRVYWFGRLLFL